MNEIKLYNCVLKSIDVHSLITRATSKLGNKIILDTELQRDVVWTEQRQIGFIDSILRGIIPTNIIINISNQRSECLDGKQRITSIVNFYNNKFPILEEDYKVSQKNLKNDDDTKHKFFSELSSELQNKFLTASIPMVEYNGLDFEQQKEVFERINNGVALRVGELTSIYFDNPEFITDLRKFCDSLAKNLEPFFEISRKEHYLFILQLFYLLIKESLSFSKINLKSFAKELEAKKGKLYLEHKNKVANNVKEVFNKNLLNHEKMPKKDMTKILIYTLCSCLPDIIDYTQEIDYPAIRKNIKKINKEIIESDEPNKKAITNKNLKEIQDKIRECFDE
jgi:hypothetical protein